MKKKSVLFIGPFPPPHSGDTVKNHEIYDFLRKCEVKTSFYNTYWSKLHQAILFLLIPFFLIFYDKIIFSFNRRARYFFLPFSVFFNFLFFYKCELHLIVIGGVFDVEIKRIPSIIRTTYVSLLKKIKTIYVESNKLVEGLSDLNIKNAVYLPNIRKKTNYCATELRTDETLKLVFISRIVKMKGCVVLANAVKSLIKENIPVALDFYGPVSESFSGEFNALLIKEKVEYKGVLTFYEVPECLRNYDVLVFPTLYETEGQPGIIIEAMMAGRAIITFPFRSSEEFLINDENAIVLEKRDEELLKDSILKLVTNRDLVKKLGREALKKSTHFELSSWEKNIFEWLCK